MSEPETERKCNILDTCTINTADDDDRGNFK